MEHGPAEHGNYYRTSTPDQRCSMIFIVKIEQSREFGVRGVEIGMAQFVGPLESIIITITPKLQS